MRTCGQLKTVLTPFKLYYRTDRTIDDRTIHDPQSRASSSEYLNQGRAKYDRGCREFICPSPFVSVNSTPELSAGRYIHRGAWSTALLGIGVIIEQSVSAATRHKSRRLNFPLDREQRPAL